MFCKRSASPDDCGLLEIHCTQGTHAHSFVESFFDDVPLSVKHLKKKGTSNAELLLLLPPPQI